MNTAPNPAADVLLAPRGEHTHTDERGVDRTLVIDEASVLAQETKFVPKVLVDQEHFSYDADKPSEAYGWLVEVEGRPDGLHGRIEWTDKGETAVVGNRYRFLSPVYLSRDLKSLGGNRFRPMRLDSLGLTNKPNLQMPPLLNRARSPRPFTASRAIPQALKNRGIVIQDRRNGWKPTGETILTLASVVEACKRPGENWDMAWNYSLPLFNRFQSGQVDAQALWNEATGKEQAAFDATLNAMAQEDANITDRGFALYKGTVQPKEQFYEALRDLMSPVGPRSPLPGQQFLQPFGLSFEKAWEHLRETEPIFWLRHVFAMTDPQGGRQS